VHAKLVKTFLENSFFRLKTGAKPLKIFFKNTSDFFEEHLRQRPKRFSLYLQAKFLSEALKDIKRLQTHKTFMF